MLKQNTENQRKVQQSSRPSAGQGRGASRRQPEFRLNPKRQAFFVVLAVAGIAIGYGLGFLNKKSPPPAIPEIPRHAVNQETSSRAAAPVRPYEEPLPRDIIENPVEAIDTIDRRALPTLKVTVETPRPLTTEMVRTPAPEEPLSAAVEPAPETPGPEPEAQAEQLAAAIPVPGPATVAKITPKIAIVIDDLGIDKPRTARAIKLKGPLTLSFMTYASGLAKQTQAARDAGHELWMHIPMEPGSTDIDPGPNVLLTGLPKEELRTSIQWNLSQFSGHVGVNNHMGSRFTADLEGIRVVMEELKKRDLLFLDSITSGRSVARRAAREVGVPFIGRNIFIDHLDDTAEIRKRLAEVERLASKSGYAVAIGHPREKTLQALGPWLDTIESKGFRLVPLSTLIKKP